MNMKGIMIRLQDFTTGGHSREKVKNCSVSIRRNTTAKAVFAVDEEGRYCLLLSAYCIGGYR